MAYYRTEENIYCGSIKKDVGSGSAPVKISMPAHGPCKVDSILITFETETSGGFSIQLVRDGITVDIISTDLDGNSSVVATDVGVWIPNAGHKNYKDTYIQINNNTTANATVIIDYTY